VPATPGQRLPIGGYLGALAEGPLVARETQRAQLIAAIERAEAGTGGGGLVLLAGEPGIGKTRLAQEVTQLAHTCGFLIASGRCYEPRTAVAYYPFLEALSMSYAAAPAAIRAALPHRWPDVARLLPDLEVGVSSLSPATTLPIGATAGADDQPRLFHQVTAFLQALAEVWPVALLLDDLHWADSVSLDLVAHLARHTPASRILLLGTYRDSEITPAPSFEALLRDLGREHLVKRLMVRRLTAEGTAALLAVSYGQETFSHEFAELLHAHAEGNPFFTAELLRELVERGDLYQENGQWQHRAQVELVLPESVRSAIGRRLARLPAATQVVLQEASVLGSAFRFTDLQAMSAFGEADVDAALEEAEDAVLVRESGQESGQAGYVFQHVLIQQVLYAQLSIRRKQRLHRAAGEALERLGEQERERRVAELAYHFARTDQHQHTLQYSMQAAARAREAGARREEAALLGQALDAATHLDERHLVTELRVKRGQAFNAAAMWADAQRELEAALTGLAPDQAERRIAILVELAYASIFPSQGVERARAYATDALVVAERIGREDLAARALSALAEYDTNEGLLRESQPRFERAFVRAGVDHIAELLTGLDQYGLNWYYLGHFEQAGTFTRQALEIAQSAHDQAIITRTLGNLGMTLSGCGRYGEALDMFAEARRRGREYQTWAWLARSISMHAGLHLALGDYAGAEELTEEAREVNCAVRFPNVTASTGIDLLLMCARRHDVGRAEGLLPHVREGVTKASGSHGWLMALRFAQAQAEVALAREALDEALRFAEDSIAQARQRGRVKYEVLGLQTRAQALARQGRSKDAIGELRAAIALAHPMGDPALFLRVVSALLAIEGDDALLTEARATVERIATALPGDLRRTFLDTDTVRLVARLSH
jgi:tetratricopeptide (TPR) repeat protein